MGRGEIRGSGRVVSNMLVSTSINEGGAWSREKREILQSKRAGCILWAHLGTDGGDVVLRCR